MLADLICNASADALPVAEGESYPFCLSTGNWVALGIVAVLLVSVALFLGIKVFARFCFCCGKKYSMVGERSASNAEEAASPPMMHLYLAHGLQAFGDRMWAFAVPVMLIDLYPDSLMPCALYSLGLNFSLIFLTSPVSAWIDRTNRLKVFTTAVWAQGLLILINCGLVMALLNTKSAFFSCEDSLSTLPEDDPAAGNIDGEQCESVTSTVAFLLLAMVLTGVAAELGSTLATTSIEKDWVVVLAGPNRQILTQFNTTLRRIDLICKLLAPTVFGIVVSLSADGSYGRIVVTGVSVVIGWNVVCLLPEWWLGRRVYYNSKQLQVAKVAEAISPEDIETDQEAPRKVTAIDAATTAASSAPTKEPLCSRLRRFSRHQTFWPIMGYTFHYFSVLNSGVLMVGYLQSQGINIGLIGAASGLGAFFGLVGTWLFPLLLDSPCFAGSLTKTGSASTWLFFLTILPSATAFYLPVSTAVQGYVIILSISVARVWLWSFDLAHTQVLQEATEPQAIGFVNGIQTSIYQLFYVLQNAAALQWDNPSDFYILAALSATLVFLGATFWSCWATRAGSRLTPSDVQDMDTDSEEEGGEQMFQRDTRLDQKDLHTLSVLHDFRDQLMADDNESDSSSQEDSHDSIDDAETKSVDGEVAEAKAEEADDDDDDDVANASSQGEDDESELQESRAETSRAANSDQESEDGDSTDVRGSTRSF